MDWAAAADGLPPEMSEELARLQTGFEGAADAERRAALHRHAAQLRLSVGDPAQLAIVIEHLRAGLAVAPDDSDALLLLAHCFEQVGDREQLLAVYAEGAANLADPSLRLECVLRSAEGLAALESTVGVSVVPTLAKGLQDGALCRLLAQQHAARARALVRSLSGAGCQEAARGVLDALIAERHDQHSFEDALALGELHEGGGEQQAAYEAYRLALSLRPADDRALEPVRRHLLSQERYEQLAEVLAVSAPAAPTPFQRAGLWRELARLAEARLGDYRRAVKAWWRSWEFDHWGEQAGELKRLYAAQRRWEDYLGVLQRQALRATNAAEKIGVFRELANFWRDKLGDPLAAAETYSLILQLLPDDLEAMEARVGIFEEQKSLALAEREMRRFTRRCKDPLRRDAMLRRLVRSQVARGATAELLESLRLLRVDDTDSAQLVHDLWEKTASGQPLALIRRELALLLLRHGFDVQQSRVVSPLQLGQACEELGDCELAAEIYRRSLLMDPANDELRRCIADLQTPDVKQRARGADRLAELREDAIRLKGIHPQRSVHLLVRAAQWSTDPADAQSLLRLALEICPRDAEGECDLLESVLRQHDRWDAVAELLQDRLTATSEASRRQGLLSALLELLDNELADPAQSLDVLGQLVEIDPTDERLLDRFRRLCLDQGESRRFADVLKRIVGSVPAARRVTYLEMLGDLHVEADDRAAALNVYHKLLQQRPDHPVALRYCRAHAESTGDQLKLVSLLSRAAEATPDPQLASTLYHELAVLVEQHFDDQPLAVRCWKDAVTLAPENVQVRQGLLRALRKGQLFEELSARLRAEVSRTTSPGEKLPLLIDLAEVCETELGDQAAAAMHLRSALQLDPKNSEVLQRLAQLYEALQRWRDLAGVLQRHAEIEVTLERKVALLHKAAHVLFEQLDREEETLAVCRHARELMPGDEPSATLMARIYERRGQWPQLVALLTERVAVERDSKRLGALHLQLGRLLMSKLEDPEGAASHFEQALQHDGSQGDLLPLLRELYAKQGRWDQLSQVIGRWAKRDDLSATERAMALYEMGRISEEHGADREGACQAYEQAALVAPDYRPPLTSLRALAMAKGQWREAVALARREIDLVDDSGEKTQLLVECAEILRDRLNRPSAAVAALETALEYDPHNLKAAQWLAGAYFDNEAWQEAAVLLERVVESGAELQDLHQYYYRLAYALEMQGGEDKAFTHYVKAFSNEPMHLPTLERLVVLCYARRQWQNTSRIIQAIVTTYADHKTSEQLADLFVKLGLCELHLAAREAAVRRLHELVLRPGEVPLAPEDAWRDVAEAWAATPLEPQLLGDVDLSVVTRVIKAMEQALRHVPEYPDALQLLAAVTMSRGDWDRSVTYLERAVTAESGDPQAQARLLICAGDITATRLLSTQRAERYYQRAAELQPTWDLARRKLEQLADLPQRLGDIDIVEEDLLADEDLHDDEPTSRIALHQEQATPTAPGLVVPPLPKKPED